ncbi:MAG: hypothetical protein F6J90_37340 [Moorea sp. SIOASIH]|uniref:hypothetical protein n=1 Tax=Moorena sp. SIOASIH TaxID=2607817 RepID=UPI0013BE798A|nr:hypothetical protein [Moorena sp. SIOASIH]NEO41684.1 hypothetical protein [Moorena sp. SIOASIH]
MLINRAPDAWHYFINYELSFIDVTILEKTLLELHKNIAKGTGNRESGVGSRESETVNYYYCSRLLPITSNSRFPSWSGLGVGSDSRFPIPVPLLVGVRGGFRFPIPVPLLVGVRGGFRFPIPDS